MTTLPITVEAPPLSREEAARIAEQGVQMLIEQFGAKRAIPFGSVRGDSPWHTRSDIDIAVEGLDSELYFKALAAMDELLPRGAGIEIDLVELESAPPELHAQILGEIKTPKDNHAALIFEVEVKLRQLEYLVAKVTDGLQIIETDELRKTAVAKWVHDFYNVVESIFERITVRLEGELPQNKNWRISLLDCMAEAIPNVRPAVIDQKLHRDLFKLLEFRQRVWHTYSYELEGSEVKERADELDEIMRQLRVALEAFEAGLGPTSGVRSPDS